MSFKRKVIVCFMIALATFLLQGARIIVVNFGDISLEQMLFHLGTGSTQGVPPRLIQHMIKGLVLRPIGFFVVAFALLSIKPLVKYKLGQLLQYGAFGLILLALYKLWVVLNIAEYINQSDFKGDWVKQFYQPIPVLQPVSKPSNLILIYAESLEKYRVKPTSALGQLSAQHGAPKQWYVMPGTQWTLAGMVSSQCALPLRTIKFIGSNNLDSIPHPLAQAVCLGDILKKQGYSTISLDGADPHFAGNYNFLSTHGFDQVLGKQEINQHIANSNIDGWWGASDEALLEYAEQVIEIKVKERKATNKPFFLSMNTTNTHGPEGVLSPACAAKGVRNHLDAIFDCDIDNLGNFFNRLQTKHVLDDTVFVIMGDHPLMGHRNTLEPKFKSQDTREVFFLIVRPDLAKLPAKDMMHMDVYPTVLSALGVSIPQNKLGLGSNVYQTDSLVHHIPAPELRKILRLSSQGYVGFWDKMM